MPDVHITLLIVKLTWVPESSQCNNGCVILWVHLSCDWNLWALVRHIQCSNGTDPSDCLWTMRHKSSHCCQEDYDSGQLQHYTSLCFIIWECVFDAMCFHATSMISMYSYLAALVWCCFLLLPPSGTKERKFKKCHTVLQSLSLACFIFNIEVTSLPAKIQSEQFQAYLSRMNLKSPFQEVRS